MSLNDLVQRNSIGLDSARERVTPQGAEANLLHLDLLARLKLHPLVIHHDDMPVTINDRSYVGGVQRNDIDVLPTNVLPDILLSPVRQRKNSNALPC